MNFNQEQKEAIATREGAWLCLATAGAGKTAVLTERVKALILENTPINEILALTFTTEAASEMERRIGITMRKEERGGFRTFHSFGLKLIFAERNHLSFQLADNCFASMNGSKVLRSIIKQLYGRRLSNKDMDDLKRYISKAKRIGVKLPATFPVPKLGDTESKKWGTIFRIYNERMKSEGQIDYDDMICEAVNLLEKEEVRKRWQYKWVHADESQDTDDLQFRILQLISERDGNVFIVGDPNQSLYQFRNARPENLAKFSEWFPGAKTIVLPENFRSTKNIVRLGQRLAPVKNELVEKMRTSNEEGEPVKIVNFLGNDDEVDQVLRTIKGLEGKSAILARTNQQIGLFETVLAANDLKFYLLGKSGFWKTSEIKNLMGLVTFTLSSEKAAMDRWSPQRLLEPVRSSIRNLSAPEALKAVIEYTKLREFYQDEEYSEADNFALGNLAGAVQISQRFATLKEFAEFANKATHASRKSRNAITLGTIHSAKGLEFDNVFVVGVSEGKLPHEKGQLGEESCIMYVAASRAAKRLQISYSGQRSRFLEGLDGFFVHQ